MNMIETNDYDKYSKLFLFSSIRIEKYFNI